MKRTNGKASIKFEYQDELVYPYGSYKKMGDRVEFYNVGFGNKQAHTVANKLPDLFHLTMTMPCYQIRDENGKTLFDSKWDNLSDFLRD